VNVISQYGCRDGLFVRTTSYDSSGVIVDSGIAEIGYLLPDTIAFAQGDTFSTAAATYRVTGLDCYDS
jgi:hypothetical protein